MLPRIRAGQLLLLTIVLVVALSVVFALVQAR